MSRGSDRLVKIFAAPLIGVLVLVAFIGFQGDLLNTYDVDVDNDTVLSDLRNYSLAMADFADDTTAQVTDVEAERSAIQDIFGSIFGGAIRAITTVFGSISIFSDLVTSSVAALPLGQYGSVMIVILSSLIGIVLLGIFLKYIFKE